MKNLKTKPLLQVSIGYIVPSCSIVLEHDLSLSSFHLRKKNVVKKTVEVKNTHTRVNKNFNKKF